MDVVLVPLQDSGTMPADNTPPIRKRLAAEAKGVATDPLPGHSARGVATSARAGVTGLCKSAVRSTKEQPMLGSGQFAKKQASRRMRCMRQ